MKSRAGARLLRRRAAAQFGVAASLLVIALSAGSAHAGPDPVAGGSTTLAVKPPAGIDVKAIKPSTTKGSTVTLKNSGGSLDPTTGAGTVETRGGFKLQGEDGRAKVTKVKPTFGSSALTAKVGNTKVKLAKVKGGTIGRAGFGGTVTAAKAKLTAKGAEALNDLLALRAFKKGESLAKLSTVTVPLTVEVLAEGSATLYLDVTPAGVPAKLAAKGVSPTSGTTAVAPATASAGPPPTFSFPLTGGNVAPDLSTGRVTHAGGATITKTTAVGGGCEANHPVGTFITQSDVIDELDTRSILAKVEIPSAVLGTVKVADFDLSTATITTDPGTRQITITGATIRLTQISADTLNGLFGSAAEGCGPPGSDLVGGDPLGTVDVTYRTH
jgi:hypothetical protein